MRLKTKYQFRVAELAADLICNDEATSDTCLREACSRLRLGRLIATQVSEYEVARFAGSRDRWGYYVSIDDAERARNLQTMCKEYHND